MESNSFLFPWLRWDSEVGAPYKVTVDNITMERVVVFHMFFFFLPLLVN